MSKETKAIKGELTVKDLEMLSPGIFEQGEVKNADLPVPMIEVSKYPDMMLKWVAVRGGIADWAIYLLKSEFSYEQCRKIGLKTHSKENINFLVPCTKEALEQYRH